MKKLNLRFTKFKLLFISIVLAAGGVGGYLFLVKEDTSSLYIMKLERLAEKPENWVEYIDPEYGFRVWHPKDWAINVFSPETPEEQLERGLKYSVVFSVHETVVHNVSVLTSTTEDIVNNFNQQPEQQPEDSGILQDITDFELGNYKGKRTFTFIGQNEPPAEFIYSAYYLNKDGETFQIGGVIEVDTTTPDLANVSLHFLRSFEFIN